MLNILDISEDGLGVMLGQNVPAYIDAYYWLEYYRSRYGAGVPHFSGDGVHKGVYVIVRQCEETGFYFMVQ